MNPKSYITPQSYGFLVFYATCSTALLGISASSAIIVQQDAWMVPLFGGIIGVGVIFLFTVLARWMPDSNIYEMNENIFGSFFGRLASLLYFSFPFLHFPAITSYVVTYIKHYLLPSTPFIAITAICVGIIVFGVVAGIEAISRTAELCFIFFLIPILLLIIFTTPYIDIGYIQPIFRSSFSNQLEALAIFMGNVVCNVVIQLSVFPKHFRNKSSAEKALWIGYSFGCFLLFIVTFLTITVLSPEVVEKDFYPPFALAQKIDVGDFFQRIESTITVVWFISIYFNLTLYLYALVTGLKKIFRLKRSKPLILPLGYMLIFLGFLYFDNIIQEREFYRLVSIPHSILVGFGLPISLVIVGALQRKRMKRSFYPKYPSDKPSTNRSSQSAEATSSK